MRNQEMSGAFQGSSFERLSTNTERQGNLIFKVTLITRRPLHTAQSGAMKAIIYFPLRLYHVFPRVISRRRLAQTQITLWTIPTFMYRSCLLTAQRGSAVSAYVQETRGGGCLRYNLVTAGSDRDHHRLGLLFFGRSVRRSSPNNLHARPSTIM